MNKYLLTIAALGILLPGVAFAQFDNDLYYGSTGSDVTALQEFLTQQGVYHGPISGNFYSLTLTAVKKFQSEEGITPVSGYVGPVTRGAINQILAGQISTSEGNATTTKPIVDLSQMNQISSTTTASQTATTTSGVPLQPITLPNGAIVQFNLNGTVASYIPPPYTAPIVSYPCPTGYSGTYPYCVAPPPECPEFDTGVYPNCVAQQCPTGTTGTYPYCTAIPVVTAPTVTQTNTPIVNIQADGSDGPVTVQPGTPVVISWSSQGAVTPGCGITGTGSWAGNWGTSGSKTTEPLSQSTVVTIQCYALVNNVVTPDAMSDSVTINVVAPPPPPPPPPYTGSPGTLTVTASGTSIAQPALSPVAAGTTGVTIGYVKLQASNEQIFLSQLGLTLANGIYGSANTGSGGNSNGGLGDVVEAYIYSGSTEVGSVTFNSVNPTPTATFSSKVTVPLNSATTLTIKADLTSIGSNSSAGIGDILKIDPTSAQGSGASTGTNIEANATPGVTGVQIFKSFPTVAFVSNSTNPNGTNVVLKKFTITANASGPVGIDQMAFSIATSSVSVSGLKLYVYTDSGYSQGLSSQGSGTGQIGSTFCAVGTGCASNTPTLVFSAGTSPIEIPAGSTYYFALLGTVTPGSTANNWTISPTLLGDTQYPLGTSPIHIAQPVANLSNYNFLWSDNAIDTAATNEYDWMNGNQIPGLPSTGI